MRAKMFSSLLLLLVFIVKIAVQNEKNPREGKLDVDPVLPSHRSGIDHVDWHAWRRDGGERAIAIGYCDEHFFAIGLRDDEMQPGSNLKSVVDTDPTRHVDYRVQRLTLKSAFQPEFFNKEGCNNDTTAAASKEALLKKQQQIIAECGASATRQLHSQINVAEDDPKVTTP